eukprot:scaffold264_cov317-Pinguiococcus_pyrenoidosus.AAC.11
MRRRGHKMQWGLARVVTGIHVCSFRQQQGHNVSLAVQRRDVKTASSLTVLGLRQRRSPG